MFELKLSPRFKDTDALGHINNASYATWFEEGRRPIFRFFVPDLDAKKWNLIIARIEIDFIAQGSYGTEVTIQSTIEKIGNSSFQVHQECHQNGVLIARGLCSLVHFDYQENKSRRIPEEIRTRLESHLRHQS